MIENLNAPPPLIWLLAGKCQLARAILNVDGSAVVVKLPIKGLRN
jgi:hypothetical protein